MIDNLSSNVSRRSPLHYLHIDTFMNLESLEEGRKRKHLSLMPKKSRNVSRLFRSEKFSSPSTETSECSAPIQGITNLSVHLSPSSSNLWLWCRDESEDFDKVSPNTVQHPLQRQTTLELDVINQITPIASNSDDIYFQNQISNIIKPKPWKIPSECNSEWYSFPPRNDEIEYLDFTSPNLEAYESGYMKSLYLPSLED
jgi:hypothetical protein